MPNNYDELRQILKGIADKFEDIWIEREYLKEYLITQHDHPSSFLDAILETARNSQKWRTAAHLVSEQLRKPIEDKTFEIALQEPDETPPKDGKPN